MTAYAELAGLRLSSLALTIPFYGAAVADCGLALTDVLPTGPTTLLVGNLSLVVTVVRSATFGGSRSARVVGGAGGWRRTLPARAYRNPGGLRLSTVLGDAARETGETLALAADSTIGTSYVRETAPASRLLRLLGGSLWWIDVAGVTRLAARATPTIASTFVVSHRSGAEGRVVVATEDLASWQPGARFSSPVVPDVQTISSVSHRFGGAGALRTEALTT